MEPTGELAHSVNIKSESQKRSEYDTPLPCKPYPAVCRRRLLEVEEQGPKDAEEKGDERTADRN